MDKRMAKQYHKQLVSLIADLHKRKPQDRFDVATSRVFNTAQPLYIVDSHAVQHIEEAARKLKYLDIAVQRAALATMERAAERLAFTIANHPTENFMIRGPERVFARPVMIDELRSLVEKGRLIHETHQPFVSVLDAPTKVERVLLEADTRDLSPAFSRMGFEPEALVFFTANHHPVLGVASENIPSLKICTLRSGTPIKVLKHRLLK